MRLLACGPLLGMAALLAIDGATGWPSFGVEVLQGGALAVLAWTIYYLFAKVFPAHQEALREQRSAFLKVLETEREDRKECARFRETLARIAGGDDALS